MEVKTLLFVLIICGINSQTITFSQSNITAQTLFNYGTNIVTERPGTYYPSSTQNFFDKLNKVKEAAQATYQFNGEIRGIFFIYLLKKISYNFLFFRRAPKLR